MDAGQLMWVLSIKNWDHLLVCNNWNMRVLIWDVDKLFTLFVVMYCKLTMRRRVDLNSKVHCFMKLARSPFNTIT